MRIETKHYKFGGLLVLALITMNAAQRQQSDPKTVAENRNTQLARSQVVDQVEPLFRALFPDQDMLRFQAAPAPAFHKDNRRDKIWMVDCVDLESHVLAQILWNVDTKRALQFGPTIFYTTLRKGHSPLTSVNEQQSVAIARAWAARLRPISGEEVLQSEYQIQHIANVWSVRLCLSDGNALIWINARSGELQNAIVQDTSATRHR